MTEKFVINGVEYSRLEDVPEQYQRQIEKMRAFGTELSELGEIQTEFVDGDRFTTEIETITHTTVGDPLASIEMDGKQVSLADVPPVIRRKIEKAMEDKDGDGVPDAVQHLLARPEPKNANPFDTAPRAATTRHDLPSPAGSDDDRYISTRTWIGVIAALVIVALAAGYWLGS